MFSLSLTAFKTGAKPSVDARTSPTHSPGAPFSGAGGSSSLLLLCFLSVNICSTVQTQTNPNPSPLMFSARSRPKVWSFMKVNWRFGERRSIGRGASVALVEAEEWHRHLFQVENAGNSRERRLVGQRRGWKDILRGDVKRRWSRGPSSCCFPKPIYILKAQVITFNEIWASQRHERLQICGLCKT